ncbi:MAG: hypothetical protein ACRDTG_00330 [Pseudonocardiaceae bacterium]
MMEMTAPTGGDEHVCAVRSAAAVAVALMAQGETQGAFDSLMAFLHESEGSPNSLESLLTVLCEGSATMASTLGVFVGSVEPIMIGVLDDDLRPMSIDQAAPVERTFVRALLAEIHGDREATLNQIHLAFATVDPQQVCDLMMRTLAGTAALVQACHQNDLPIPGWLANSH